MITTVTLNPMLDKTVSLDSLKRGFIHRAAKLESVAGGKGINVSRQLKRLNKNTLATGFLGGEVGSIVRTILDREGIEHKFVETGVMTREGVTYRETDGTSTAVFEPALPVPMECVRQLTEQLELFAKRSSWIVCSGSSPGGEADAVYHDAVRSAHASGCKSVVDSYGEVFRLALKAAPTVLKLNHQEYEQTFGKSLRTEKEIRTVTDAWVNAGVEYVVITDGANPAYAASTKGLWKVQCNAVSVVNAVGSGDSLVAGFLFGFEEGWGFEECAAFGAAAGAANAGRWEVANSDRKDIDSLRSSVVLQQVKEG